MATISKINGINEDDISHHNGGAASLYASKNGDTWGHYAYQGSNYGWACGGYTGGWVNTIDKTNFSSHGNSTDAGDLDIALHSGGGASDKTYGWVFGGYISPYTDMIQKFNMLTDASATDIANLTRTKLGPSGCNTADYGYAVGGYPERDEIQRWAFVSTSDAADVGNLSAGGADRGGASSSSTHGFHFAGEIPGAPYSTNLINKFSFATDTEAGVDHGDLYANRSVPASHSSTDYGWCSGGGFPTGAPATDAIDRFAFSSNSTATDWEDLYEAAEGPCGASSTTRGYAQGHTSSSDTVQSFPYASQTESTDVGDLSQGRYNSADNVHY